MDNPYILTNKIIKFNTDGELQWIYSFDILQNITSFYPNFDMDSFNNIYIVYVINHDDNNEPLNRNILVGIKLSQNNKIVISIIKNSLDLDAKTIITIIKKYNNTINFDILTKLLI